MSSHILLLEDDAELSRLIKGFLMSKGYEITACRSANRAQQLVAQQHFDLLLCDVMLPGESGFDFVAAIRDGFPGPIIFMTAQTQLQHQLHGFSLGAQDYLLKPVDPRLLHAKIQVFLPKEEDTKAAPPAHFKQFNLTLDHQAGVATLAGQALQLTTAELRLLSALLEQYGKVVSREWLFQHQLGRDYDGMDRTMDGRASRLRKKLQTIDPQWTIGTVWGQGYRLIYEAAMQA
ncbi:response regulator transcription factor [Gallaecimonas kandeliae]|uniref:response regulator transcription factor n=1 Tax=Gallaecimonas kandeliae TaxID=3029055 RepID=UPI002649DE3B|nr:response regulator transcription factor [Gallaecimonas kandeliae]WKE65848.1 response regulator transcription factor [Gallaecimonas kandeliae]